MLLWPTAVRKAHFIIVSYYQQYIQLPSKLFQNYLLDTFGIALPMTDPPVLPTKAFRRSLPSPIDRRSSANGAGNDPPRR